MATITLRSVKGSPLTNAEVDANFSNINTELGTKLSATGGTLTGGITVPSVTLSGSGGQPGVATLTWNDTTGTLDLGLKGGNVTMQIGEELFLRVTNSTGSAIPKGSVVYITGSTGNHVNVVLSQANSEVTSSKTLGITAETIANAQTGFVATNGIVSGLDTSTLTEGGAVWLSATVAGGLTSTRPSPPDHAVLIGWCVKSHASVGALYIHIANGYEVAELHDVLLTSIANNQVLSYESASGLWKNRSLATVANTGAFSDILSKPTTLSGYGITDAPTVTGTGASGTWGISITGTSRGVGTTDPLIGTGGLWVTSATGLNVARNGTAYVALDAGNYNSYSPTLTGTGASGTWGISITGNAATATSATDSTKLPLAGGTLTGGLSGTTGSFSGAVTWGDGSSVMNAGNRRSLRIGYSGGNYGAAGYGIDFTTSSNVHNYALNDIVSLWEAYDGIIVRAAAAGTVGTAISWTNVLDARRSNTNMTFKGNVVLDANNYNSYAPTLTGTGASGSWGISVTGNAGTATTLQTARTINGTSFNGSANITTANWGTARTLTIGATGKSVDGSGNVSWTLAEIGALSAGIAQQGGKSYVTHDFNTYPALYDVTFVNPTGSSNLPTGMSAVMSYRFIMGAGDTTTRGFDLVGAAESSGNLYMRERSIGTWSRILHSNNFNSYSPTLTGGGASGTWSINVTGSAGSASNSTTVGGLAPAQFFNNMGNNHNTYTDFNNVPGFGAYYVQQGGNSPTGTASHQWYGFTLGLGNEYALSSYASQLYWPRRAQNGETYIYVRDREGGTWNGWTKIRAGYADSAGSATDSTKLPLSGGTLTGLLVYSDIKWSGDQNYGLFGRNAYLDTVNGRGSDPLELNYYDGGPVKIGTGTNGSKSLYAAGIYDNGNQVLHAGNFTSYVPYAYPSWPGSPGTDANSFHSGNWVRSSFTYSNNAPHTGTIVHFPSSGYDLQLNGTYGGQQLSFRSRNGDNGTWNTWRGVLHDGNYNSYAPTLTGGGASGTWSINITGGAGLLSALGNYVLNASTNGRDFANGIQAGFVDSGTNGYPNYGSIVRIKTYPNDGGTAELYFPYGPANGGTSMRYRLGQYNNAGWTSWKTVLDDSNYNSYAPTLSGTGATGTWGINITGNAGYATTAGSAPANGGTATALNSSNYISRTGSSGNLNTDFNNTPAGTFRYHGDDSSLTNSPGGTWWFYEHYRHSNSTNYWGTQIAWGWEDNALSLAQRNVSGGNWSAWVRYLNSSNYNSYSPTLTGGGASGTWSINITGNAGTLQGYQWASAGKDIRGSDIYADSWLRNYNSGTGLYNQATANHWYSDGQYWNVGYSGTTGIRLRNGHAGTILGYLYAETSGNFGLLHNGGGWAVQVYPGGGGNLHGSWAIGGNTPLTSANYTNYSPPYSGGTLTGTWYFTGNGNTGSSSSPALQAYSTGGNGAYMSFHRGGYYAVNMGLDSDNVFRIGGWSASANRLQMDMSGNLTMAGLVRAGTNFYADQNYGYGLVGVYASTRYQGVFAMGDSYKLPADGTSAGNLYGIAWSYPSAGGVAGNLDSHGMLVLINGGFGSCMSYSIVAAGNVTAYSDERLKTNWRPMPENFVERLAQVKVGIYDRIDGEQITQVGIGAQSFQRLLPEAITKAKDEMGTLSVSYGNAAMASAVELAKEIIAIKRELEALKARLH